MVIELEAPRAPISYGLSLAEWREELELALAPALARVAELRPANDLPTIRAPNRP